MDKRVSKQKCRTCLKSSTKVIPLTKPVTGCSKDVTYLQLFKEYVKLEYDEAYEPQLPQFLCFLCSSQLKSTYIFIEQARHWNIKLINALNKQLCLKEEEIELPEVEDNFSIKKQNAANNVEINIRNSIANQENSNHENNLMVEESDVKEEEIIEYEEFQETAEIEPVLTTEQIIEFDTDDSSDMDNKNFSAVINDDTVAISNKEESSLSCKIEDLENAIQCHTCNELIANQDSLINHICIQNEVSEAKFSQPTHKQKPLRKEKIFTCEKCLNNYNNYNEYLKHKKEKHNSEQDTNLEKTEEKQNADKKVFECRFCDHIARTYSGLKYHNRAKHPTEYKTQKCNFCSYTTTLSKYVLLCHIKTEHQELIKTLKSKGISKLDESINSSTNNGLSDNSNTNDLITQATDDENISDNDNEQDKDEISDEDFIRNMLNMKKKLSTSTLVRRCEECGKVYQNYKTLIAHQLEVHKRKDQFSFCPYCDKKCKRKAGLKFHIRQKHGPEEERIQLKPRSKEKRFMCAECSYTCTTSTVLNIHNRVHHTLERPYKCDICSKSFVVPYDLKIHRYLHTGEKPYKCSICLKSFRDPSHMRKHKGLHTNKTPFTCDVCGKGFTQSYNLSVHKRTHLKGNKLGCSVCGKFFKNKSMLHIHQINENHYNEVL